MVKYLIMTKKNLIIFFKHLVFAVAMIGALNWGIVGIFNFEIISFFLGAESILCRFIYAFIGLCAIISATFAVIDCQCYCEQIKNSDK